MKLQKPRKVKPAAPMATIKPIAKMVRSRPLIKKMK